MSHSIPSPAAIEELQTGVLAFENKGAGIWVDVSPHPQAKPSFCDENVSKQIRDHGGEALSVWDVTEVGPFVEMEAHVIWRGPSGRLVDVSPSLIGSPKHFVIPSLTPFQRPFPGSVMLCRDTDPRLRDFAYYSTLANAVIAPHRVVGQITVTPQMIQSWTREFVAKNTVKCDIRKLEMMCFMSLSSQGVATRR